MSWTPHHNEVVYKDSLESIVDAIGGTGIVSGMAVTPGSGSYYINIASGTYKIGGTEYSYAGVTNFTLGPYIPNTTNYYQYVLVSVNSSGSIVVSESTEASATSDLVMDYTSSSGNCKVATIQLRNGQTTIDSAEILDSARMVVEANLNLSGYVTRTTTQTISGVKTFTGAPEMLQFGNSSGERGLLIRNGALADGPTWLEFKSETQAGIGPVAQIAYTLTNRIPGRLFLAVEDAASSFVSARVTQANRGLSVFDNGAILASGGVGEGSVTYSTLIWEMNLTTFEDGDIPSFVVPTVGTYENHAAANIVEVDTAITSSITEGSNGVSKMHNTDGKSLKIARQDGNYKRMVLGAPKSYNFRVSFDYYITSKTNAYRGTVIYLECYMFNLSSGNLAKMRIATIDIGGGTHPYDLTIVGKDSVGSDFTLAQIAGGSTSAFNSNIAGEWIRIKLECEAHSGPSTDNTGEVRASMVRANGSGYAPDSYGTAGLWNSNPNILEDYAFVTHLPLEIRFVSNNSSSTYGDTVYIDNFIIETIEGHQL